MPTTNLLKTFGLSRNPFTDRTAEKTLLDPNSLYLRSDLAGFRPNDTTYVFFGRRGSGKTTIRLQMEDKYRRYNDQCAESGSGRGHFMVDLCRPGHMTACLTTFQESIKATTDNWDAAFQDEWSSADMVDCILSYSVTVLVQKITSGGEEARAMINTLRSNPKACKQFLLLIHLYARTDQSQLAFVRSSLMTSRYTPTQIAGAGVVVAAAAGGAVASSGNPEVADALAVPLEYMYAQAVRVLPPLRTHPKVTLAALGTLTLGGLLYYQRYSRQKGIARAISLQSTIRVVKPQSPYLISSLLDGLFTRGDSVDTIRTLWIGVSAHQKLELLEELVKLLGYESVTVFGDCFDEVTLLDPVRFPGAIKVFAREICRNDLLNFGKLHFFFPDSRLSLDLNTDKTLKEARFDRHFVRDLTWSRHQLEELAESRFRAAQEQLQREALEAGGNADGGSEDSSYVPVDHSTSFADLFKKVRGEDFSSYLSKLSTPRELLIMMTEMFARIEAFPEGGLTAQDMEIAVTKALEQAV